MNIPLNVLLIFLGSILTFTSTWTVENLKNKRERNEKEQNFKLFIRQEFRAILKGLEKLNIILEKQNFFDNYVLTQLEKNVLNLESYRKEAFYVSSIELQEKFIDLISDISTYLIDARGLQNYYWNEANRLKGEKKPVDKTEDIQQKSTQDLENFFNKRRIEKTIELIDIKRRIDDFLKQVSL